MIPDFRSKHRLYVEIDRTSPALLKLSDFFHNMIEGLRLNLDPKIEDGLIASTGRSGARI